MTRARQVCGRNGLFNVEYLTVLVLFMVFSTYFVFRMLDQKPAYLAEVQREIFRSESYRLSEMLVDDAGAPANWRAGTAGIARIGLSDEAANVTNLVSEAKLSAMKQMCTGAAGYANVKALVGASHDFSLVRIGSDGAAETVCGPGTTGDVRASMTRFVAFDTGDYGQIIVQMW